MTPAEFAPLAVRAIGKHAQQWEIDRVFAQLEPYPAWAVVAVLVPLSEPPKLGDLTRMVASQVAVRESRDRALNPSTCEHSHIDTVIDPCPQCVLVRRARAHRWADQIREQLKQATS